MSLLLFNFVAMKTILEFNLPKFGQFVLCKIEQHDIIIAQQQMEINKLKNDIDMVKRYLKATAIDLATVENNEMELKDSRGLKMRKLQRWYGDNETIVVIC